MPQPSLVTPTVSHLEENHYLGLLLIIQLRHCRFWMTRCSTPPRLLLLPLSHAPVTVSQTQLVLSLCPAMLSLGVSHQV